MSIAPEGYTLPFKEFRARVGASERNTRRAIQALALKPRPSLADNRVNLYHETWVEPVREWIKKEVYGDDADDDQPT
jgi:hypothetical protein